MDAAHSDMVAQFSAVTGANASQAQTALTAAGWDLEEAVALYFAANEETQEVDVDVSSSQHAGPAHGDPATPQSSQPTRRQPPSQRRKQMTLQDLQRDVESDDDDDEEKKQDMFAGGEKSGLAVQNPAQGANTPADHFRNIMSQARANRERPSADESESEEQRHSHFTGRAQTLGGDDAESRVVENPRPMTPQHQRPPRVTRTLHLWADGVSIDEGPLFRFDDPANQDMMAQINQGRAPLSLLDVQPDQEVDLNLIPHKDENYVAPKKAYKPFGGQGQRLGSPTPGSSTSAFAPAQAPVAGGTTLTAQATTASNTPAIQVDDNIPTVTLQVRLGDGTRLQSRFNTTHTIGDIYDFVDRASSADSQRPYALMTTFPSKELNDKSQILGDISDFKRGGVVVQKWK